MTACSCAHCGLPIHGETDAPGDLFCCAGCAIASSVLGATGSRAAMSRGILRVGLGIFLTMNVMIFSLPLYESSGFAATAADGALRTMFRWIVFLLATPAVIVLTRPLARDAWAALRRGQVRTSLLVVTGTSSAYLISVINLLRGGEHVYFDSACMILTLVTLGAFLEAKMKRTSAAGLVDGFVSLPVTATVETEHGDVIRDVEDVRVGDQVRVTSGGVVPVDGRVREGVGTVEESDLTGEAIPRVFGPGDELWAGTTITDGMVVLVAEVTGDERRLHQVVDALKHALATTPRIQRLADRMATVFVPVVIVLAVGALAWGGWTGQPFEGAVRALAVALIACPCALGFAVPLTSWTALRHLQSRGVLLRSSRALEAAATVRQVAFDKTGTLTTGAFEIERVESDRPVSEVLAIAAALERVSTHPIARALRDVATADPDVDNVELLPGRGVRGTRAGDDVMLISEPDADLEQWGDAHVLALHLNDAVVARIAMRETIRDDASDAMAELDRAGMSLLILTGDRSRQSARVATTLGIPIEKGMMPTDKAMRVQHWRQQDGRAVAFVGDGSNDAPVLAAADLGIAMQSASDLSRVAGDVVLLSDRLGRLPVLFDVARRLRRRVRVVLGLSAAYNAIGIGFAITGYLTPVFAATAMIISSALVLTATSRPYRAKSARADRSSCTPAGSPTWSVAADGVGS